MLYYIAVVLMLASLTQLTPYHSCLSIPKY